MDDASATHYIARMSSKEVDLEFIQRQQHKLLQEMALVRQEAQAARAGARQVGGGFVSIGEQLGRLDRRIGGLREDFETMLKLELGGTIANLGTRFELRAETMESRVGGVGQRHGDIDRRLDGIEAGVATILTRPGSER